MDIQESGAVRLGRLMEALSLSGKQLAGMLTGHRFDGKNTSQATVSRWLNGTYSVEPGVIAWLTELLRNKAITSHYPLVQWEGRGSLHVTVTSLKGGSGVSTLSLNMAVLAREIFGVKTKIIIAGRECEGAIDHIDRDLNEKLRPFEVESEAMTVEELIEVKPEPQQIVFVDLYKGVGYRLLSDREYSNWFFKNYKSDISIIPGRFDKYEHQESAKKILGIPEYNIFSRLVQMVDGFRINFDALGVGVEKSLLAPVVVPWGDFEFLYNPAGYECNSSHCFSGSLMEEAYTSLLVYLFNSFGIYPCDEYDRKKLLTRMSTDELLAYIERKDTCFSYRQASTLSAACVSLRPRHCLSPRRG